MVQLTAKAELTHDASTREKTVNQYRLGSTVGRGGFCKVKWAEDSSGSGYGIKVLSRCALRNEVATFKKGRGERISFGEAIQAELKLLKGLQHEHIVLLHEIIDDPDHENFYIVYGGMAGGALMQFRQQCCGYEVASDPVAAKKHWGERLCCKDADTDAARGEISVYTEAAAQFLIPQLLEAVKYVHEQGIIHKDLKPDNILLSLPLPASDSRISRKLSGLGEWPKIVASASDVVPDASSLHALLQGAGLSVRICDFGCSEVGEAPDHRIFDALGTHLFTPPECFEALHTSDDGILGKPRDMWSVGCTIFNMLYGRCPFWAEDNFGLQCEIMGGDFISPEGILSMQAMDLIRGLMTKEPGDRLTAASALQHPWLRSP